MMHAGTRCQAAKESLLFRDVLQDLFELHHQPASEGLFQHLYLPILLGMVFFQHGANVFHGRGKVFGKRG